MNDATWKEDRVGSALRGENPTVLRRMPSGFAVIGDTQFLPGYCLLLAESEVVHLTDLDLVARRRLLTDMSPAPGPARGPEWFATSRETFLERFEDRLDGFAHELLAHAETIDAYARERLRSSSTTLLHHDLHLDNVHFDPETDEPILLDWARVAKGPGVLDLAELLFMIDAPLNDAALVDVYIDELGAAEVEDIDRAAVTDQLSPALLLLFLRSTCGVARWVPESVREERLLAVTIERAIDAVGRWRQRTPELFRAAIRSRPPTHPR